MIAGEEEMIHLRVDVPVLLLITTGELDQGIIQNEIFQTGIEAESRTRDMTGHVTDVVTMMIDRIILVATEETVLRFLRRLGDETDNISCLHCNFTLEFSESIPGNVISMVYIFFAIPVSHSSVKRSKNTF